MLINAPEIALSLYYMVTTCQILSSYTFNKIKQKTSKKINNIEKLIKRLIE